MNNGASIMLGDVELARWEENVIKATSPYLLGIAVSYIDNLDCVGRFDIRSQNYKSLPKQYRCHSRKRFIKTMMSAGYSYRVAKLISTFAKMTNDHDAKNGSEDKRQVTLQSLLFSYIQQQIKIIYDED